MDGAATFVVRKVTAVAPAEGDVVRLELDGPSGRLEAVSFPSMVGEVEVGDRVVVNTTGIALGLGTGGVGFVLWNLDGAGPQAMGGGHIVKLRYTPWQRAVLAAEEPDSSHHELFVDAESIDGAPVVACGLHSQIAGVAAGLKAAAPHARVGYLMSDGGALPLAWSDLVRALRQAGLIDATCTYGHAFGGDLEAVNAFSGLVGLRRAARADAIVAALGPGIVGTGTTLGFTGIEQGQLLDAATALGGRAVACLRISAGDPRPRHAGVSHHSLTALRIAARERCTVVLPTGAGLPGLRAQLDRSGVSRRHDVVEADGAPALALLRRRGVAPTSMGRALRDVPELFAAAGAAGAVAATLL